MYRGERFNGYSHLCGTVLTLAGAIVLVFLAALKADPWRIVSFSVYGVTLCLLALRGEESAQRFFDWVARTSPVETVRSLAREIAREEAQHVLWLKQALGDDSQCKTDTGVACDVNYQ